MFCSGATPRRALKSAAAPERSREGPKEAAGWTIRSGSGARPGIRGASSSSCFASFPSAAAAMSSVDLSASAWALERLAARRAFPSEARTGACRSLFGPVDHEQLHRELRDQLRQIRQESQRRWEFDFHTGAPLAAGQRDQARFQWEEVDAAALPAFYRETLLPGAGSLRRRLRCHKGKAPQEEQEEPESHGGTEPPPCPLAARSHEGADAAAAEKQESGCYSGMPLTPLPGVAKRTRVAHITDFFAKRKRVAADASSALALEQTPRKRLR
nr:cyclin-dependent kinase inhibitor 1C [Anolis sagrei ordinatus]